LVCPPFSTQANYWIKALKIWQSKIRVARTPPPTQILAGQKKPKNQTKKTKPKQSKKNQNIRTYAAMGRTDGGPTDLAAQIP
jgi:hypothetical protein